MAKYPNIIKEARRRIVAVPHPAGTAMSKLTELEQRFVELIVGEPCMAKAAALRAAGYQGKDEAVQKHAYRLMHDPQILAAREEVSQSTLVSLVPAAIQALGEIATNPHHRDRKKASDAILNRTGHQPIIQVEKHTTTTITHRLDRSQIMSVITELVERNNVALPSPTVTGQVGEIKDERGETSGV